MYAVTYNLPVCVTRCGNFYGPGDLNWNRIVPGTLRSALLGQRPIIRSDGKFVRDYLYVDDGAAAYMDTARMMAERRELCGQAFNFSNEEPLTVREIVDRILAVVGRGDLEPDVRNEASNEIREQFLSAKKARELLGWKPRLTLDAGLERTAFWYRKQIEDGAL
jgi:CDP-glucose 4,6-dehydratase